MQIKCLVWRNTEVALLDVRMNKPKWNKIQHDIADTEVKVRKHT